MTTEELFERVLSKTTIVGVVWALAVIILAGDSVEIECLPPFRVWKKLICLFNFDELCLSFGMVRFVRMPLQECDKNEIKKSIISRKVLKFSIFSSPFLGQLFVSFLYLWHTWLFINTKDLIRIAKARGNQNKSDQAKAKNKIHRSCRDFFAFSTVKHNTDYLNLKQNCWFDQFSWSAK